MLSSIRIRFVWFVSAALFLALSPRAAAQESPSAAVLQKYAEDTWKGDLDGMVGAGRRRIRVVVPYSKTLYFVDKGQPRGIAYDAFKLFEDDLNKHLKKGHVRVHVVFRPGCAGRPHPGDP